MVPPSVHLPVFSPSSLVSLLIYQQYPLIPQSHQSDPLFLLIPPIPIWGYSSLPPSPMGCNVKDKSLRTGRKHRHSSNPAVKLTSSIPPSTSDPDLTSDPDPDPDSNLTLNLSHNPNPNPNPNPNNFDESGWGYCTEEQLEELLLKNLDYVYKEALSRLVSLGYDETLALRALLCNGHCYGSMDVLSNVLHNAVTFLNASESSNSAPSTAFSDLRHLQEYSLAGMVCLLQQVRPHLTRGDAMWCLLMSELHVGRASTIDIPARPDLDFPAAIQPPDLDFPPPGLCKFHAHAADPFPPPVKSFLKRNVSMFAAAGYHRKVLPRSRSDLSGSSSDQKQKEEKEKVWGDSDRVASVLKSLESMSIEEEEKEKEKEKVGAEDQKKEMILDLVRQIRDLENQLKERKEWAQQKAMQAAKKLSNDLTELKLLRMEREENQRVKKGKQALEDSTMKRLSEMESALKKASGQVDRANTAVRKLETENAEIRAEMEASKLSASESVTTCLEVAKREKKCLKRLLAWEKQREKLQEDITEEREKIVQVQQQLSEVQEAQKETEVSIKLGF